MSIIDCASQGKKYFSDAGRGKNYAFYLASYYYLAAEIYIAAAAALEKYKEKSDDTLDEDEKRKIDLLINTLKNPELRKKVCFILFSAKSPIADTLLERWASAIKKGGENSYVAEKIREDVGGFLARGLNDAAAGLVFLEYASKPEFILDARKLLRK